jgi:hypothetical protein
MIKSVQVEDQGVSAPAAMDLFEAGAVVLLPGIGLPLISIM